MKTILSYILSVFYYIAFGLTLVIFHVIQWAGLKLGGYNGHKRTVDAFNFTLLQCLKILGTKITFKAEGDFPEDAPMILVSNHQSMYDISPISYFMRKYHPKFVSKIELGKGIPSVSFNLRHGGSVLIDRKDAKQSLLAIRNFGKFLHKNNYSGVIFPEGTRSKTGKPKRFSENGVKMLVKFAPGAYVVPVTINNSWKLVEKGSFPLNIGVHLEIIAHKPIKADSMPFDELFKEVEQTVKSAVTA
ncbi:lysophospholipid acyltransferase family protein [Aureivirga marina]|uniref:lysophospholipid acyltransferase family protein n=1 Tax=Aureivirga marina TaxID=1182451 RepID=UPI0018CBCD82|nr:lysophospholipid acyltransferase family protein [Aureivirga marina]